MFRSIKSFFKNWTTSNSPLQKNARKQDGSLSKYEDLTTYTKIYDKNISKQKIKTNIEMKYSSQIQFGDSYSRVKALLPNRIDQVAFSTSGIKTKVLLFQTNLGGQNVKVEMHFYSNKLFFYKFIFTNAQTGERSELSRALIQQYNLPNIELSSHTIFDQNRNCIRVEDNLEFTISYTQMTTPFFIHIEAQKQLEQEQMITNYSQKVQTVS